MAHYREWDEHKDWFGLCRHLVLIYDWFGIGIGNNYDYYMHKFDIIILGYQVLVGKTSMEQVQPSLYTTYLTLS